MLTPYVPPTHPVAFIRRLEDDHDAILRARALRAEGRHTEANLITAEVARRLQRDVRLMPEQYPRLRLACLKDAIRCWLEARQRPHAERLVLQARPEELAEVEAVLDEEDELNIAHIPF